MNNEEKNIVYTTETVCTDGNTVFRCDSDKNSLVTISML